MKRKCIDSMSEQKREEMQRSDRERKRETRTIWPRQIRELILDSDSPSQGVKG